MVVSGVGWDPDCYLRYADERARPFADLLARVPAAAPSYVVDLGCGPGTLTRTLLDRWPAARVEGIDSSPEMVRRAGELAVPGRLSFRQQDLREWRQVRPVDVVISNATLHWIPDHLALLPRLVDGLAPGGSLAVQMPANGAAATHRLLADLRSSPRWRRQLAEAPVGWVGEAEDYAECLAGLGCAVDVWTTTYLHVLPGEDAVLDWMMGAALRPVLAALDEGDRQVFLTEYGELLRAAYPRRRVGTLLPYRRIFAVARRSDDRR